MAPTQAAARPTHLLLLPEPPIPTSYANLKAAYETALGSTLRTVARSRNHSKQAAVVEIALPCPVLWRQPNAPRSRTFHETQVLVAGVYKLLCAICAAESLEIEGPGGVDARILILAEGGRQTEPEPGIVSGFRIGAPAIDLLCLARSERPWVTVFSLDSHEGNAILGRLVDLTKELTLRTTPKWPILKVKPGQGASEKFPEMQTEIQNEESKKHYAVAVGGTFDHLHAGHKLLLTMTAFLLEPVTPPDIQTRLLVVGISGAKMLQNKQFAEYICSWEERQAAVTDFLRTILDYGPSGQGGRTTEKKTNEDEGRIVRTEIIPSLVVECAELFDPYGPTITTRSISALVVSAETSSGGKAVNEKRKDKGWQPLDVFEVEILNVDDESSTGTGTSPRTFDSKISSTEIRRRINEKQTI